MPSTSFNGPMQGSIGGYYLRESDTLSAEADSGLREEGLLAFGHRLAQAEHFDAAVQVYTDLTNSENTVIKEQAQKRLDAILGRGSFGERFEFLAGRFVQEATNLQVILPMMAGSMAFQIGKGFALGRMTAAVHPSWWMRGMAGNWAASGLGFGLEVSTFVVSGRAVRHLISGPQGSTDLRHEFGGAGLTLGLLKLGGAMGQSFLQKTMRNGPANLARAIVPQATMFWGLWAAHQIETHLGWRPRVDDATTVTDIFSSMMSLGIGGRLASHSLGKLGAIRALEMDLRMRMGRNTWGPELLTSPSLKDRPSIPITSEIGPKNLVKPILMASRPDGEAKDPQRLDLTPSQKLDLAKNLLQNRSPILTSWRDIQLTLAYAETVRDPNVNWVQKLRDPSFWEAEKAPRTEVPHHIRKNIDQLFEGYFLKLKDQANFLDNEKWEQLETEFLLYCNTCRTSDSPKKSFLEFQELLLQRRVSARAVQEEKHESLAPVSFEGLPRGHRELPFFWLRKDSESQKILRALSDLRDKILQGDSLAPLQKAMAENIPLADRLERLTSSSGFHSQIGKKPRRRVIWNPFEGEHRDSLVVHPHHGEGDIISEEGGQISVSFSDAPPVKLSRSSVAAPRETEKYWAILAGRVQAIPILPFVYSLLALRPYLSKLECADFLNRFREAASELPTFSTSDTSSADVVTRLANMVGEVGNLGRLSTPMQDLIKQTLLRVAIETGIDPITFSLRLMVGENPYEVVVPPRKTTRKTHTRAIKNRNLTPDLIRELLRSRPWMPELAAFQKSGAPRVTAVGHYYTGYYSPESQQPHDLTDLYFAFRNGEPEAFQAVAHLFQEPVHAWMSEKGRGDSGILVPMIGQAPLKKLAEQLTYPVVFPWKDRPADYGQGVEGQRASVKMRMVQAALRLDPKISQQIQGKPVLVLDDNGTDFITWMWARKLLLDAGASEVGLVVLTQTQRYPHELAWSLRR